MSARSMTAGGVTFIEANQNRNLVESRGVRVAGAVIADVQERRRH